MLGAEDGIGMVFLYRSPGEQSSLQKPCSGYRHPFALLGGGLLYVEETSFPTGDREEGCRYS